MTDYIKLHSDDVLNKTNGTSLSGYLSNVSYVQLVDVFGEPTYAEPSDDNKIQKEWVFQDQDGDVFTVYDWKTYDEEYTMYENLRWHVGSKVPAGEFIAWVERMLDI